MLARLIVLFPFWVPALVAVVAAVIGAPIYVGPLLLVAFGVVWFWLAASMTIDTARRLASELDVPPSNAFSKVDKDHLKAVWPEGVLVPSLTTASWTLVVASLIWLWLEDHFVLALAVVIGIICVWCFYVVWRKRHPLFTTGEPRPRDSEHD